MGRFVWRIVCRGEVGSMLREIRENLNNRHFIRHMSGE